VAPLDLITGRRNSLAWIVTAATLGALVAVPLASEAASAAPKCFGKRATIVGTAGNDKIKGTPKADVIVARGGNDVIDGLGGKDLICAGGGADKVRAGVGADKVSGGYGNDRISGYKGNDKLFGMQGRDQVSGGAGDDRVNGGAGTDRCYAGAGSDTLRKCERADLAVTVNGPNRATAGDVTFTVTVTNDGPSAVDYTLTLALSTQKATCADPAWAGEQPGATLAAGSSRSVDVTASSCTSTAKGGAKVGVQAAVASFAPDPDMLDNEATGQANLK
jgi:Ca2+-binding RTX toxin-like protein